MFRRILHCQTIVNRLSWHLTVDKEVLHIILVQLGLVLSVTLNCVT